MPVEPQTFDFSDNFDSVLIRYNCCDISPEKKSVLDLKPPKLDKLNTEELVFTNHELTLKVTKKKIVKFKIQFN